MSSGSRIFYRRNPLQTHYSAENSSEDKYEKNTKFEKITGVELEGARRDNTENEGRKKDKELLKKRRAEEILESIFTQKAEKKRS
uniref:Uncharacterized protein n=1 Tax=Syphacia muris TaxID=451379 RepID=A0A0N5B1A8_9BILA